MNNRLSQEQLDALVAYLNHEEGSHLDLDAAQAVISLASSISVALMKENRRLAGENISVRRRLERAAERNRKNKAETVEKDAFEGTGLDSVDVTRCALYCLQQQEGAKVTKSKLMLVVYLAYCSYLYHQEKRLFVESPVAIASGPVFWKASNKVESVVTPLPKDAWDALAKQSPSVAKFIFNYCRKYGDFSDADLKRLVVNSMPFKHAMEIAAGKGRKSQEISDKDIWIWRDSLKK